MGKQSRSNLTKWKIRQLPQYTGMKAEQNGCFIEGTITKRKHENETTRKDYCIAFQARINFHSWFKVHKYMYFILLKMMLKTHLFVTK